MKKWASITLAVALAATLLLGSAWTASGPALRYEVSSSEYVCLTDPGTVWQEGNVLHMRNVVHVNVDVSDDPEMNGINTTVADADVNLKNGNMTIHGTWSFQPEGIDGTWEGSWNFIANNGIVRAQAVAQGTSALKGKQVFIEVFDVAPDPDGQDICDQVNGLYEGSEVTKGYVLVTGAP